MCDLPLRRQIGIRRAGPDWRLLAQRRHMLKQDLACWKPHPEILHESWIELFFNGIGQERPSILTTLISAKRTLNRLLEESEMAPHCHSARKLQSRITDCMRAMQSLNGVSQGSHREVCRTYANKAGSWVLHVNHHVHGQSNYRSVGED